MRVPENHRGKGGQGNVRQYAPFALWLAAFYTTWLLVVVRGGLWDRVLEHWPIAASMAAGSYFAGSTPIGGGAVGFPVLVLLFDRPAAMGRVFGLAIQSIGMVSASILILASRQTLDWRLLRPALKGSLIATPLGIALAAPAASDLAVKLVFAVIWASFGLAHLRRMNEIISADSLRRVEFGIERETGLAIGVVGGVVAALTGVGIDMILYETLVFFYRADLKTAIPTSVVLMAFTSVVGIATCLVLSLTGAAAHQIPAGLFYNWLAAAPVVAVGAPLGAIVVKRIPRMVTMGIVSTLCIAQFAWTLLHEQAGLGIAAICVGTILALNGVLDWLLRVSPPACCRHRTS